MKKFSIRYAFMTFKMDQLVLPAAFLVLFAIVCLIQMDSPQLSSIARSYLGTAIPLTAGILAAYSVLEDPAIELRFATPIRATRTLVERLGMILIIQTILVTIFQLFYYVIGGRFSMFASFCTLQLAWLIPTLVLMSLGCALSLVAANSIFGSLFVGMVWLVELIARGWFAVNFGKYFLVFMGALMPDHPDLIFNHISLLLLSILLLVISWLLLRRQERYI